MFCLRACLRSPATAAKREASVAYGVSVPAPSPAVPVAATLPQEPQEDTEAAYEWRWDHVGSTTAARAQTAGFVLAKSTSALHFYLRRPRDAHALPAPHRFETASRVYLGKAVVELGHAQVGHNAVTRQVLSITPGTMALASLTLTVDADTGAEEYRANGGSSIAVCYYPLA